MARGSRRLPHGGPLVTTGHRYRVGSSGGGAQPQSAAGRMIEKHYRLKAVDSFPTESRAAAEAA
jgi:hypothetical protein